ncbi:MAG: hypothetical protein RPU34_15125 [Candidatus Sedimenticola sp. (ex Thyasira tokunagai)]
MIDWNTGELFKKPFESDSNAIRRFFVANDLRHYKKILGEYKGSLSEDKALDLVKSIQGKSYWEKNHWLYQKHWGKFKGSTRQCPLCAKELYHTHAFSYPWLKICPIHHIEITSHCPDCNAPWHPQFRVFTCANCPTCGTRRAPTLPLKKAQVAQLNKSALEVIRILWELPRLDQYAVHILYYDFVNHGLDAGIIEDNDYYPVVSLNMSPKLKKLLPFIEIDERFPLSDFSKKTYKLQPIQDVSLNDNKRSNEAYINTIIRRCLNKLSIALESVGIDVKDEKKCHPLFREKLDAKLIFQTAFFILTAILFQTDRKHASILFWIRFIELVIGRSPSFPPIVHLLYSPFYHQFYSTPKSFRIWMLTNNIKCLFICLILDLDRLQAYEDERDQLGVRPGISRTCTNYATQFRLFRLAIEKDGSCSVLYKVLPSWNDIVKTPAINYKFVKCYRCHSEEDTIRRLYGQKDSEPFIESVEREAKHALPFHIKSIK